MKISTEFARVKVELAIFVGLAPGIHLTRQMRAPP